MTLQEPSADEIVNRPLDDVVLLEIARMRVERLGDLWDRQLRRMPVQQEREDGPWFLSNKWIEPSQEP